MHIIATLRVSKQRAWGKVSAANPALSLGHAPAGRCRCRYLGTLAELYQRGLARWSNAYPSEQPSAEKTLIKNEKIPTGFVTGFVTGYQKIVLGAIGGLVGTKWEAVGLWCVPRPLSPPETLGPHLCVVRTAGVAYHRIESRALFRHD